jgi:hypothetical protein
LPAKCLLWVCLPELDNAQTRSPAHRLVFRYAPPYRNIPEQERAPSGGRAVSVLGVNLLIKNSLLEMGACPHAAGPSSGSIRPLKARVVPLCSGMFRYRISSPTENHGVTGSIPVLGTI